MATAYRSGVAYRSGATYDTDTAPVYPVASEMGWLTVAAEIAFGNNPLDTSPAWTDVGAYVQQAKVDRGRTHAVGSFNPATMDWTLNNNDRRFDPMFTDGPYGANLKPMKPCRLRVAYNLLTANQSDLETDASGWTAWSNCAIVRSTAQANHGSASLKMTSTVAGSMTAAATPPLTQINGGQLYTATAAVRPGSTARSFVLAIDFYTSAGVGISSAYAVFTETGGAWTTATCTAASPPNAAQAIVSVAVRDCAGAEDHYVDTIGLMAGPGGKWDVGTGLTAIFTGFVESWQVQRKDAARIDVALRGVDGFKFLNYKTITAKTYYNAVTALSPTNYWRLDDRPGSSNFIDSMGTHDLTVASGVAWGAGAGPVLDQAGPLVTDASTGMTGAPDKGGGVYTPTCPIGTNNSFSVVFWMKTSGTGVYHNPLSDPIATNGPIIMGANNAGQTAAAFYISLFNSVGGNNTQLEGVIYDGVNQQSLGTAYGLVVNDGQWHHYAFTRDSDGKTLRWYADGVQVSTATYGYTAYTPASGYSLFGWGGAQADITLKDAAWWTNTTLSAGNVATLYNSAIFPSESVGARIGRLCDLLNWPNAWRSLDTGPTLQAYKQNLTTTTVLTHIQACVDSDGGQVFIDKSGVLTYYARSHSAPSSAATFSDTGGASEVPYLPASGPVIDDLDVYNDITITGDSIGTVRASDSTSQGLYGTRSISLSSSQLLNPSDATSLASALLARYKDPTPQTRQVSYTPASAPAGLMSQVFLRELLDRITYKERASGTTTSSQTLFIEHMSHTINVGELWRTDYSLSPF